MPIPKLNITGTFSPIYSTFDFQRLVEVEFKWHKY